MLHRIREASRTCAGHETVDPAAGQYVRRGGVTINMAEGYFSQLKRSIDGTHHHVSIAHLSRYLGNFDFLYSLYALLSQGSGRCLTY